VTCLRYACRVKAVSTGDVTLAARLADVDTFSAFGTLVQAGSSAYVGKRHNVLFSLRDERPGPRRVTHVERYPDARRVVFSTTGAPMWLVVLGAGTRPSGPPSAFSIPPGAAVIIDKGIWHAGPRPLEQGVIGELIETVGVADHLDRQTLRELTGVEAVRVVLPDEPDAPAPGLNLSAPNAVMLDASLHDRIRVGCVCFDSLEITDTDTDLVREAEKAADSLRSTWGPATDLAEIPGVTAVREMFRGVDIEPDRLVPSSEVLLAHVLQGNPLRCLDSLRCALDLCALRMRVPLAVYDCERLADQVLIRTGAPGEGYPGRGGKNVHVEGRPVLCDREGPFGSPVGDAERADVSPATRRALVALYLPSDLDAGAVDALIDGVAETVTAHCGGSRTAHLVVG